MRITKALADYISSVDKHLADWGDQQVGRSGPEAKFVQYCAFRDQDPADVASTLHFCRADLDVPSNFMWLAGALDVFYSQQ